MYREIMEALSFASEDPSVAVTLVTGAGNYYSSGNDLSNFSRLQNPTRTAAEAKDLLVEFVGSFIDHPKPLVAGVNGPAIGIAVTTLALCDAVYASSSATFHTPFRQLGQAPEGCSSYTFPYLMGETR